MLLLGYPKMEKFLLESKMGTILAGLGLSILGCFALRTRRPRTKSLYEKITPCSDEWIQSTKYNSGKMGHSLNKPEGNTE